MTIETLTGRTIYCMDDSFNYGNYGDIAIEGVSVWEKDGMKRTYINLSGGGARLIAKLFIVNEGKARADFSIDTAHGKVCGIYGGYASSGAKQHAARAMAEALFA